ncbi:hypothetical protein F444_05107, partial [Phytophthora nicotianae P1976]
ELRSTVAQRHEGQTLVSEERQGSEGRRLLAAALSTRAEKDAGRLAHQSTSSPQATGRVEEGLDLRWQRAEARGEAEQDAVRLLQGVHSGDGVVLLGGGVHLAQDLVGERLLHLVDLGSHAVDGFDALLGSLGELGDVAIGGVVDDSDLGHDG